MDISHWTWVSDPTHLGQPKAAGRGGMRAPLVDPGPHMSRLKTTRCWLTTGCSWKWEPSSWRQMLVVWKGSSERCLSGPPGYLWVISFIYIFLWHIMVNPGRRYLEVFQCNWKNQVQYMLERCDGFCCKGSLFVFASVLPKVEAKRRRGKIPVTTSPEVWQANTTIYTCNYMQQSIYADCLGRACQPKTSQALFVVLFCFVCCFFATRLHNRSFTSRVIAKENGIVWSDRGGLWTRQDVCGKCP